MQDEDYASHRPSSHGRRRFGRNRSRTITTTVLFVGFIIGLLAGRWSIEDIREFVEDDPPTPKDPHTTMLDEFEGMYVAYFLVSWLTFLTLVLSSFRNLVSPARSLDSYASPTKPDEKAIVTSLYTDAYGIAVSALGYSISKTSTSARKIVIYLPEKVSNYTLCRVEAAGWELLPVKYIPPPDGGEGVFWRFLDQYTKLRIWTLDRDLTSLKSIVYLDADTLVKRAFDELFDIPFVFSASPDVYLDHRGFTVGFNAGVLAIKPDSTVFDDMLTKIYRNDYKHAEAEQGFLNLYYGQQVVRLPHVYNGNLAIKGKSRQYWDAIQDQMRIVHFTLTKPFDVLPKCGGMDEACTLEEIWDTRRHKSFLETAKMDRNGDYKEEIEWWGTVYDEMAANVKTDHCSLAEQ